MYVSDDGRVEARKVGTRYVVTIQDEWDRVQCWPKPIFGRWLGCTQEGYVRHAFIFVEDGDDLHFVHAWMNPLAEGTEPDPRTGEESWTLARVIERD